MCHNLYQTYLTFWWISSMQFHTAHKIRINCRCMCSATLRFCLCAFVFSFICLWCFCFNLVRVYWSIELLHQSIENQTHTHTKRWNTFQSIQELFECSKHTSFLGFFSLEWHWYDIPIQLLAVFESVEAIKRSKSNDCFDIYTSGINSATQLSTEQFGFNRDLDLETKSQGNIETKNSILNC